MTRFKKHFLIAKQKWSSKSILYIFSRLIEENKQLKRLQDSPHEPQKLFKIPTKDGNEKPLTQIPQNNQNIFSTANTPRLSLRPTTGNTKITFS